MGTIGHIYIIKTLPILQNKIIKISQKLRKKRTLPDILVVVIASKVLEKPALGQKLTPNG